MRGILILVAIAVLALLPSALAIEPVTLHSPDVSYTVRGQTIDLDTSQYAADAPGLVGSVHTKDVTVDAHGPTCTVDPTTKLSKGKFTHCGDPQVSAPAAEDATGIVDAQVGLKFAGAAAPNTIAPSVATIDATNIPTFLPSQGVLLAAAAAGASFFGIYAAWRALKWTGLFALIPLYSHISDNEILDDPNRAGIYRLIQVEAGISTKDIAEQLGLAWGTVTHHLSKLEKRRFVVSKKYGKYRRYFANGEGGTEMKDQVAVLRLDRTGDVAALIRSNPGLTQKAVSTALGVSSSTILWHVKRLEGAQLITKV
ncbi:MAG: winged helix-turn-helix transcriptional regulator, partial [Candidatus Thermoplasmatota archaeon]